MNLFSFNIDELSPLANQMRPKTLSEYVGQKHILGEDKPLKKLIESDNLTSIILWGGAGVGKTSLANVIANSTKSHFVKFSAVENGVADLRVIVKDAKERLELNGKKTTLFVDEIHRLNKSQQDAFLPHVERGIFILIGATTENPSFTINNALLSRSHIFTLKPLSYEELERLLEKSKKYINLNFDDSAKELLIEYANGDARRLLSTIELISKFSASKVVTKEIVKRVLKEQVILYDRKGEEHYNLISAFIKSMRGSDVDATVYYLARMLLGGEDPRFIARRLVIFASEDVGLADKDALNLATSAYSASEKIGMPEIRITLSHVAIYLAKAPKDNSAYLAINSAFEEVKSSGNLAVPMHLRNAPTKLLKELGYSDGYEYAHNLDDKKPSHSHLPDSIKDKKFFKK